MTLGIESAVRRIATYERVSSDDQKLRETIKNQTEELARSLQSTSGILLVDRYADDGISGTVPMAKRPGGRRLLEDAAMGRFDEVWVWKIDRLGRDGRLISALGLSFHSFLDGVGIGLGFHVSSHIGLLIAIAVIAHDFCDGLNTVSLMLINRNTTKKAVVLLFSDALTPILGVLVTYFFTISDNILVLYLGFFAGFLLYIGAADLLPEAHSQHSSYRLIGLTILGFLFIFLTTRFISWRSIADELMMTFGLFLALAADIWDRTVRLFKFVG